jgi:hypothetical protein
MEENEELKKVIKELTKTLEELNTLKNAVYAERNTLVALLTTLYPSGVKKTSIEGWDPSWHNCVYIDLPWGQASWHYHDNHAFMFEGIPKYQGNWDGHNVTDKYGNILAYIFSWRKLTSLILQKEPSNDKR